MRSEQRTLRLIEQTIEKISLDLSGLCILTEAATGHFAVTPSLALMAGAERVIALARDSAFGTASDAEHETRGLAAHLAGAERLSVIRTLDAESLGACDVLTNLGGVRPIDAHVVQSLRATAVVALMCESWEFRSADVDRATCERKGILILGTNEHHESLPIFRYCGPLAIKMTLDAGFEVLGTSVAVLGRDRFAPVVADALTRAGANVRLVMRFSRSELEQAIRGQDVVFLADYASDDLLLGDGGIVSAGEFAAISSRATVIQLAGAVNELSLVQQGVRVWPTPVVGPRRMSRTLAAIGVRPVVELHAAGLAVGAAGARARIGGASPDEAIAEAMRRSPFVQPLQS